MSDKARAELAPTGVLRAGINLSNFLLVTGRSEKSEPVGVAPDMAKEIAASLGVPVTYVPFKSPGELAPQAGTNNIRTATLMPIMGLDGACNKFVDDKLDALAGLRPGLLKDLEKHPGLKI